MDAYFHTSTSGRGGKTGVINTDKYGADSQSFWKLAKFISKHDHRIVPTNTQQIASFKKRTLEYIADATKPVQKSQEDDTSAIISPPSIPAPVLLPTLTTTNTFSSFTTTATTINPQQPATTVAPSTTVIGTASGSGEEGVINPSQSGSIILLEPSLSASSSYKLRKAMAWLGRSFHKFQYNGLLKFQQKRSRMGHTASLPSLVDDHDFIPPHRSNSPLRRHAFEDNERPSFASTESKKKDMEFHLKVLRITNLASSKEQDYELDIRVNDMSQTLIRGNMTKVTKKISSSKSPSNSITVPIKENEQVSLEFVVATPTPKTFLQSITAAILNHHTTTHHKKKLIGDSSRLSTSTTTITSTTADGSGQPLQVVGIAHVPHHGSIGRRETRRYKLANPNQVKGWDLDLTVELSYTQPKKLIIQPPKKQQPPWALYKHTSDLDAIDDQDEQCNQDTLAQAHTHCRDGDYLTFYVHSKRFPTWERFWVTLQEDQLWLRNFSYKEQREPTDIIPLQHLNRVTKPSLDDQDHVCVGRSHGLVLQMNPEGILMDMEHDYNTKNDDDQVHLSLEGKIFLFADNATNALHWRRALASYYKTHPSHHPSHSQSNNNDQVIGVHSKYIW